MSGHSRTSRRPLWGAVGVVAVLAITGYLFAANARLAGGIDARQPQDLGQLVDLEQERSDALAAEVADLRAEIDRLTDEQTAALTPRDSAEVDLIALVAGRVAVTGPGLTVQLSDAPAGGPRPSWVTNDDLVVHQQDLQAVIDALWAGGAEAMTLQGQRVISTSAFRCVGNVLLLHGQQFSPPYVVQVIGDTEKLRSTLLASSAIQAYLDYVDAVGLGWSVSRESSLQLPAFEANVELKYASVPDGVDVPGTSS